MRILIQRVKQASVLADGELSGKIDKGLLVFLGIHKDDNAHETAWLAKKLVSLRIFEDDAGKMNRCIQEVDGNILIVSQFTLYANCNEGRRPDFFATAPGPAAEPIYEKFVLEVSKELGKKVETGRFGAYMEVALINDGPVTFLIDGKKNE